VLHWHGDTFDLPAGAERLASTPECVNQAFSLGAALAVQFHPEVSARHFERWLICNTAQIALMKGHTVRSLRDQARRYADAAAISGDGLPRGCSSPRSGVLVDAWRYQLRRNR